MWFKKKSVLQAEHHYDTEKSADGSTDLRTTGKSYNNTNSSINDSGLPSPADAGKYFYLPALGYYGYGYLYRVGDGGYFWASHAYPGWVPENACMLRFLSGNVLVDHAPCETAYRVHGFE